VHKKAGSEWQRKERCKQELGSNNKMMKQHLRVFILWALILVTQGGGLEGAIAKTFTVPWSALDFTTPSNTTFALGDQLSKL
jgi:hypothetical protein